MFCVQVPALLRKHVVYFNKLNCDVHRNLWATKRFRFTMQSFLFLYSACTAKLFLNGPILKWNHCVVWYCQYENKNLWWCELQDMSLTALKISGTCISTGILGLYKLEMVFSFLKQQKKQLTNKKTNKQKQHQTKQNRKTNYYLFIYGFKLSLPVFTGQLTPL